MPMVRPMPTRSSDTMKFDCSWPLSRSCWPARNTDAGEGIVSWVNTPRVLSSCHSPTTANGPTMRTASRGTCRCRRARSRSALRSTRAGTNSVSVAARPSGSTASRRAGAVSLRTSRMLMAYPDASGSRRTASNSPRWRRAPCPGRERLPPTRTPSRSRPPAPRR